MNTRTLLMSRIIFDEGENVYMVILINHVQLHTQKKQQQQPSLLVPSKLE
jgi:hypothetical protein